MPSDASPEALKAVHDVFLAHVDSTDRQYALIVDAAFAPLRAENARLKQVLWNIIGLFDNQVFAWGEDDDTLVQNSFKDARAALKQE